jgi:hypothetical protein
MSEANTDSENTAPFFVERTPVNWFTETTLFLSKIMERTVKSGCASAAEKHATNIIMHKERHTGMKTFLTLVKRCIQYGFNEPVPTDRSRDTEADNRQIRSHLQKQIPGFDCSNTKFHTVCCLIRKDGDLHSAGDRIL